MHNPEIKFRAWDRNRDKWIYVSLAEMVTNRTVMHWEHLFHWNQFTGLKDKSDKEIYKGDLLLDTRTNLISEVRWDERGAWMAFWDGFYLMPETREVKRYLDRNHTSFLMDWNTRGQQVVYGNIYETPLHVQEV